MLNKTVFSLTLSIVSVLLMSGCGNNTLVENQIEKKLEDVLGQNSQVDINKDGIKLETSDGVALQTGDSVKLPDDFPNDVYVVAGEIKVAMKNMYGAGYNLSVLSDKSVVEVQKIYKEQLVLSGWKLGADAIFGDIVMLSAQKDKRTASISLMVDDSTKKTSVTITLMEKP